MEFKNKKCKCGCGVFVAVEPYFLRGKFDGDSLYLKATGESDGIRDIKCEDCGKKLTGEFNLEFC